MLSHCFSNKISENTLLDLKLVTSFFTTQVRLLAAAYVCFCTVCLQLCGCGPHFSANCTPSDTDSKPSNKSVTMGGGTFFKVGDTSALQNII